MCPRAVPGIRQAARHIRTPRHGRRFTRARKECGQPHPPWAVCLLARLGAAEEDALFQEPQLAEQRHSPPNPSRTGQLASRGGRGGDRGGGVPARGLGSWHVGGPYCRRPVGAFNQPRFLKMAIVPTRTTTITTTTAQKPRIDCSPGTCVFMPKTLAMSVSGSTMTLIAVSTRKVSFSRWLMTASVVDSSASTTSLK